MTSRLLVLTITVATLPLSATADGKGPCLQKYPMSVRPLAGVYVPQCTTKGYFKVVQVHGSTGHQWCANPETGTKIEETDTPPGKPVPYCGKCLTELAGYFNSGLIGASKPLCDDKGQFKPLQQDPAGRHWCVNPKTGEKVPGTERKAGAPPPACG